MFVRRPLVRMYDNGESPDYTLQTVQDAGAVGMLFCGIMPPEKLYEMENIFGSADILFRVLTDSMFTHSAALDIVSELITR